MDVFIWMHESVSNEKLENDDSDVGFEISVSELFFDSFYGPEIERLCLSVRVDWTEVQWQWQIETKFPRSAG